jgi:hypothetical protein
MSPSSEDYKLPPPQELLDESERGRVQGLGGGSQWNRSPVLFLAIDLLGEVKRGKAALLRVLVRKGF